MPPIALNDLLGDRKSNARQGLCKLADSLIAEGSCMNRLEALRLLEEELYCLQAEERGMLLIIRGWGESMDLGLLNNSIPEKKLKSGDWAQAIRDVLQVTSARRQDWNAGFIQTTNMSLAFKEDEKNQVIDLSCRYTNYDLDDNDEDSLDTDLPSDQENEEEEENDEDASHERVRRHQNHHGEIGREQLRAMGILDDISSHSSNDDVFYEDDYNDEADYEHDDDHEDGSDEEDENEEDGDEDEDDDDDNEDDDDDDEDDDDEDDDDEDRERGQDKTRVDFTLKSSQANVENGKSNVILRLSFTTCSRHVWDPVLYEDEGGNEERGEKGGDVDYYSMFERSGTGTDRKRDKKLSQIERLYEDMFLRRLNPARSKAKVRKNFETFFLEDQCECNICSAVHGFRVEINWKELYRLSGAFDPLLKNTDILPTALYRPDAKVTDPTDDMFPFVRAVRIMSFFLVFCGGSSGYAISPVDMLLGTLVSTGIPVISGWKAIDLLDAYASIASDESLGVD